MKNITAIILTVAFLTTVPCNAAPNSLFEEGDRVRSIAKTLPAGTVPADWHFFIFNEAQWINRPGAGTHTAYSYLDSKHTYIRETYILRSTDEQLRHTIAHEMGHRICNCTDEATAEGIAAKILTQDSH